MKHLISRRVSVLAVLLFATSALIAEQAELKIEVKPKEAFVFVDGKPIGHHDKKLELTPGNHTIGVYNYGFISQVRTVTLNNGDNPELDINLEPAGDPVKGPWGRLKIEGVHNRDAVFLNGKTTDFFVGHADETTSHVFLNQKFVLPAGVHEVTIVDPRSDTLVFSGPVSIFENRETILEAKDGSVKYEPWKDGAAISSLPRFQSTSTETIVAVAPVKGTLSVEPAEINCGHPVRLAWTTDDAVQTSITAKGVPVGQTSLTGEQMVSPKETTTYELRAVGPGGVFTTTKTVRVDNTVQTSLTVFPSELRYRKTGDTVEEQATATLKWSASNADSVRIDPIGTMSEASGQTSINVIPINTDVGPVSEMKTYRITATNVCGGSDTGTVSLHVTGSIEKEVAQNLPPKQDLPETASPLPLIGLLGLGSLVSGLVLHGFRKKL